MPGVAVFTLLGGTLLVFGWVGLRARRPRTATELVAAPDSQSATTIGLSFLASGMGAWILFAPPEVGAFVGVVALGGYALGAAMPSVIFGVAGPRLRQALPAAGGLRAYVSERFGQPFQLWVAAISLLYMFIFLTAELTAVGAIAQISGRIDPVPVIVAVAAVTAAYTAVGGLRASLDTDRWQGVGLALLVVASVPVLLLAMGGRAGATREWNLGADRLGWEAAATLLLAVAAANLFHEGYWQRARSARSDAELRRGGWIGAAAIVPVVALVGGVGVVAAATGLELGTPPAPFFAAAAGTGAIMAGMIFVLGLTLVASSVDTLQNGVSSLLASRGTMRPTIPRLLTVGVTLPAVLVAIQGHSVLRLFLIADLLCAATAIPVLIGLWRKATTWGSLAGAAAGLLGALAPALFAGQGIAGALERASFPGGVPTLDPFLGAVVASAVVSVAVSRLIPQEQGSDD